MQATGELADDDGGDGGSGGGGHPVAEEAVLFPRRRYPWIEAPNYGMFIPPVTRFGGFNSG